jgi:hypothetical protein
MVKAAPAQATTMCNVLAYLIISYISFLMQDVALCMFVIVSCFVICMVRDGSINIFLRNRPMDIILS